MARSIALMMLAALSGPACDQSEGPIGPGATCRDQSFEGVIGPCVEHYWCGVVGRCEPRVGVGETCGGDSCDTGLLCGNDGFCRVIGQAGAECTADGDCASGLACNYGYGPSEGGHGQCQPPASSAIGEPCWWENERPTASVGPPPRVTGGCAAGLVCVPPAPPDVTVALDDSVCVEPLGTTPLRCRFAGSCQPEGSVAAGEPCANSPSCAAGLFCYDVPPPWSQAGATRGFRGPRSAWIGPWPAECVATDALLDGDDCFDGATCAPGLWCSTAGPNPSCRAPHTAGFGEACADGDGCWLGLGCSAGTCQ